MNELQIFKNDTFGEVRTVVKDNEPWFVAADVCRAFGVTTPSHVTSRLDEDEKGMHDVNTLGGKQTVTIINEAGLYHALFTMEPKNARGISDEAINERIEKLRSFKRWITHEVIPSIRKHGAYLTTETAEKIMADPDNWIKLLTALKDERAKTAALTASDAEKTAEIDRLHDDLDSERRRTMKCAIQATFFEAVMDKGDNITLTEAAKEIGCGRDQLIDLCLRKRYLYRAKSGRLLPMANRKAASVFTVKEYQYKGGYQLQPQTYVTLPGRAKLLAECVKDGIVKPTLPDPLATFWEV